MNTNEIIKVLSLMDDTSLSSTILPWQAVEICQAKELDPNKITDPTQDKLAKYARSLSKIKVEGDVEKVEYFCFVPMARDKWKVYVVDKFSRLLARLEDYEGEIKEGQSPNQKNIEDAFLLRYK